MKDHKLYMNREEIELYEKTIHAFDNLKEDYDKDKFQKNQNKQKKEKKSQ